MQAFTRLSTDVGGDKYIAPTSALYQRYARRISELSEEVVQIATGSSHLILLTESGRVWVEGWNRYGQLGLGDTLWRPDATQVMLPEPIREAVAGAYHTLLLTESGELLAAGDNRFKQLGVNSYPNQLRYRKIKLDEPVKLIGAGRNHSVVVTESGRLWVCGLDEYGQLGLGESERQGRPFTHVELPAEVIQIKTTGTTTAVITRDGQLWYSGLYDLASLVRPSVTTFTPLMLNKAVSELVVDEGHIVYVTGSGHRSTL